MFNNNSVAVVIPAFNEQASIGLVVAELVAVKFDDKSVVDTIVVCDNASTDDTAEQAIRAGATVVYQAQKGYGIACQTALQHLPPHDVIAFVDGDYSAVTGELLDLLAAWHAGADLVIGARNNERREPGALTPQQILGNQFATWLMRRKWQQPTTDLGPFRVIGALALQQLQMRDAAFGWTMEMQAKAFAHGHTVVEVPVTTKRRIGYSKVSGTLRGTIGATWGILSTFARIAWLSHRADWQAQPPA